MATEDLIKKADCLAHLQHYLECAGVYENTLAALFEHAPGTPEHTRLNSELDRLAVDRDAALLASVETYDDEPVVRAGLLAAALAQHAADRTSWNPDIVRMLSTVVAAALAETQEDAVSEEIRGFVKRAVGDAGLDVDVLDEPANGPRP